MFEVAHAVLEADQVLVAVGQRGDGGVLVDRVRAVVDDDAEGGGPADGADVFDQAALVRFGQVGREQQDALGAGGFGGAGVLDGLGGGSAGGGENRDDAADFLDGGTDNALGLGRGQREALTGSAGREETGDRKARLPGEVLAVVLLVELQFCIECGDGEGEQAVFEDVRQFLGGVFCHGMSPPDKRRLGRMVLVPLQPRQCIYVCLSLFMYGLIPFMHCCAVAPAAGSP